MVLLFSMDATALTEARNIIRQNPYLIWHTQDYDQLNIEAIAEAIFNYGSWDQFQKLCSILGVVELGKIFFSLNSQSRCNLHKLAQNYFSLYFAKYAR